MLDNVALPFICAAKSPSFAKWFACLSDEIINHPLLHEEEKILGIWLAIQSTKNESFACAFNYAQIATAMNKSSRKIHRILTRLRTMGFLIANLPIHYGELTPEMVHEIRTLELMMPPQRQLAKEYDNGVFLPYIKDRPPITLNLIKNYKPPEQKKKEILKTLFNIITNHLRLYKPKRSRT